MMTSNHEARFHATREPLGSYRITPLTGEWATGSEREVVLAQGAAEALFALMSKEREPLVDLRTDLLPLDWPNDEYGYTTEGYYTDRRPGC
jgi:hypothetical protein